MSDTPITDSAAGFVGTDGEFYVDDSLRLYVQVEDARKLERQLGKAVAFAERLLRIHEDRSDDLARDIVQSALTT